MSDDRLTKIAESGLTAQKVATDRRNSFDVGVQTYVEEVYGDNAEAATAFRGKVAEALATLTPKTETK